MTGDLSAGHGHGVGEDGPDPSVFRWGADDLRDPMLGPPRDATPFLRPNPPPALTDPTVPGAPPALEVSPESPATACGRPRRAGRLAAIALAGACAGAVGAGAALWAALNSIDLISADPLGNALHWLSLALVMVLLLCLSMVLALVSMVRRKRWPLGLLAVVVALVVTPLSVTIGFDEGLAAVKHKVQVDVQREAGTVRKGAGGAASRVVEQLRERGVPVGPLKSVFGRDAGPAR